FSYSDPYAVSRPVGSTRTRMYSYPSRWSFSRSRYPPRAYTRCRGSDDRGKPPIQSLRNPPENLPARPRFLYPGRWSAHPVIKYPAFRKGPVPKGPEPFGYRRVPSVIYNEILRQCPGCLIG